VKERHKVTQFPLKIGRSYKNDIIIDDTYVSPEHIEMMLDGDGHILVTDLHSDNGMFTLHPLVRHDILTLEENQRIRIGHTDIRVRSEDYQVKETVFDHGKPSEWHLLMTNALFLPLVWALTAGILLANQYFETTSEAHFNQILGAVLPVLIVIVVWTAIWSIVSKVVTHKFYFAYHGIFVGLLLSGFYFIELAFTYLEFIFPIAGLADLLIIFSDLAFTFILFYGHLRQSTHFTKRKTRITSAITTGIIVGVAYLITYVNEPQYQAQPVYSDIMKPPMFMLKRTVSIDSFFNNSEQLAESLQEED
ncbi:MAG: FHA domain-containing protein, partial [Thioalkalispiraceae bacterium]